MHITPQEKEQKRNKRKDLERWTNPKSTLQELLRRNLSASWNKNEFCFPKMLIGYIKIQHTSMKIHETGLTAFWPFLLQTSKLVDKACF